MRNNANVGKVFNIGGGSSSKKMDIPVRDLTQDEYDALPPEEQKKGLMFVSEGWESTTLPSTANWYSTAYGDGKYVAVEYYSNKAAYSTDGITWTTLSLPSGFLCMNITYGGGKFVASGFNNVAYSTDGITWEETILPFNAYWRSVTYGDGKFVAVGSTNKAVYSTDGITWEETELTFSEDWRSIAYGDGKFVALSNGNTVAYSTDGITWEEAELLPHSGDWRSIVYGDGKFVAAIFNNPKAAYSTDGITWEEITLPTWNSWNGIAYGDGKFVAVTHRNKAAYSTDGITWQATTLPSTANWYSIAYGDGKFVAAVYDSDKTAYIDFSKKKMILNGQPVETDGSGPSYTIGDGLSKDGDTISVTAPTRGIYTKEEFDALPEAQRNKGFYVVDDGQSGGGMTGGGMTQEEADTRYLSLSGGEMCGTLSMGGEAITNIKTLQFKEPNGLMIPGPYFSGILPIVATLMESDDTDVYFINGFGIYVDGKFARIQIGTPISDKDATNKKYVDDAIEAAIAGAIGEAY